MNLFQTPSTRESRRAAQWRRKWADPTTIRQWHNPAEPMQARRIEAARSKRERRACKLHNIHARGPVNHAHLINYEFSEQGRLIAYEMPARLNPTYVAK